ESRGGLVENVERATRGASRELGRELHPLGLAARDRRRRLAEPDVAEANVNKGLQLRADIRDVRKDVEGLLDGHLEHIRDRAALVVDLHCFPVVAPALADFARDVDVGEELHLDLENPLALAVLAAPAFHVEAEAARLVAAQARLGYPGEELADRPEEPRIGRRIGARGAADR